MHMKAILPGLFISSWLHISQPNVLEREGITHVLTVMEGLDYCQRLLPFKRMIIPVDDDDDEPMIDYFDSANKWIDEALADGGQVMVHWYVQDRSAVSNYSMAGRSRSATIVAAYLMQHFKIGVAEAISKIEEVRYVYPNRGFQEQLQVYRDCNYTVDVSKAAYRRWVTRE
jgi:protein-tyrosine phosphatase